MQVGEVLAGKYRILKRLGEGGEGSVYLAVHMQTEMLWAVKEIRVRREPGDAAPCHELQMMKRLKNRHLPQIIDVISRDGNTCLVMEYVRGIPMNYRLKKDRTLSFKEVQGIAEQVTDALCYLESRQSPVCHLDIKPSNLIRRPDGLIKLVDFGSAWKEREPVRHMGTDGYAAPEQYLEGGAEPDVRTDIYALGATMYRMISGKLWSPAMRGSSVPNCPAPVSDLILRCLKDDPAERFQSAALLRVQLRYLRRREKRQRGRKQVLGALAMAFPAAALCLNILPSVIDISSDESWNYGKLISEAGVVSEEEGQEYYSRAVFLNPERSEAYLRYLSGAQTDGILSEGEERFLRDTLHTVRPGGDQTYEELLSQNLPAYIETALNIGLAYWYSCRREDNRRIALGWFEKAVGAGDGYGERDTASEADKDRELAELYLRMGKAMEKFSSGSTEDSALNAADYWENVGVILKSGERSIKRENRLTWLRFCREALCAIPFISGDLSRAGVGKDEQTRRIGDLETMAQELSKLPSGSRIEEEIIDDIRKAALAAREAADHEQPDMTEA